MFPFSGLNPAECEVNFLKIVKKLDFYGINLHSVLVSKEHKAVTIFIKQLFYGCVA
jgi:hypothetical protein